MEDVYRKPDVKIFKESSDTEAEFALIEHNRKYHATWDPDILNANDFNEPGNISFKLQNWIFGAIKKEWIDRESRRGSQGGFLQITDIDATKGIITFKQNNNQFSKPKFDMSLLVLIKATMNLEIYYPSSFLSFLPNPNGVTGKKAIANYCQTWHTKTKEKLSASQLFNCPCTLTSAMFDNDFQADPTCSSAKTDCHENIDANRCYVRKIQGMYVSVYNQVCYYFSR